jgi:hypothetical protein
VARVIAEQSFKTALSDEELSRISRRLDACLEVRDGCWVRSYVSADRTRMICDFEAPDAESVRQAMRSAQVEFDRVWSAQVFAVEDYPELLAKLNQLRAGAGAEK